VSVDWRQRSACKDVDPDLFFQETGRPSQRLEAICRSCVVLLPCTFDALKTPRLGYQAGLTKVERDRVRRWDRSARERAAVRAARAGSGEGA